MGWIWRQYEWLKIEFAIDSNISSNARKAQIRRLELDVFALN
jgi:hypothetical protein